MRNTWRIIHELDDLHGNPTCWVLEINHNEYGKWIWISLDFTGIYTIEVYPNHEFKVIQECKSLSSAKRWIKTNIVNEMEK